jgi:signal transduction histidine kinase
LKRNPDILSDGSGERNPEKEMQLTDNLKSDVLTFGIVHDLNNILTTISGYAEMLQEDLPKNSPLIERTGKIILAVSRAKSITNQIIDFRKQAGKNKIPVNVNDILKETIDYVGSLLPPEIILTSDIPATIVSVLGDPTQLFRVFLNLMTNAVQSLKGKSGEISVKAGVIDGNQVKSLIKKDIIAFKYAHLTFKDTGSGIDNSLINRIFEPFYTSRELGTGTGIGLSVVHGIISELEGEILVSSKENEGSVFNVYIPVYQ